MWPISYRLYTAGSLHGACPYPEGLYVFIPRQHLTINAESILLPHLSLPLDISPQEHCSATFLCAIAGKAAWKAGMKYKSMHTK